jgi:hypothetical protein
MLQATLVLLLVASMPLPLYAQDAQGSLGGGTSSVSKSLEEKVRELEDWVPEEEDYQEWATANRNKFAHNSNDGRLIKERKVRPEPPAWLAAECEHDQAESLPIFAKACELLRAHTEQAKIDALVQQVFDQRLLKDKSKFSIFFERIHLDGAAMMGSNQQSLFGIAGVHITLVSMGRVHFYGPPGVLFISVRNRNGSRVVEPWFSWGVSLELGKFRLPTNGDILKVHLNVTKNWKWGGESIYVARNGVDMMGVGVSWARK